MAPPKFERIGSLSDLDRADQFTRWVRNHDILVFRTEDGIRAFSNVCPHFGGPVGYHKIRDGLFTCLWHNLQYRVSDGQCLQMKYKLREYKTWIDRDEIYVQLIEDEPP